MTTAAQLRHDQQIKELMAEFRLGLEARDFLKTDMGRYLIECALQARDECTRDFAEADIHNTATMAELQRKAYAPKLFLKWLNEALNNGKAAEYRLKQIDSETID